MELPSIASAYSHTLLGSVIYINFVLYAGLHLSQPSFQVSLLYWEVHHWITEHTHNPVTRCLSLWELAMYLSCILNTGVWNCSYKTQSSLRLIGICQVFPVDFWRLAVLFMQGMSASLEWTTENLEMILFRAWHSRHIHKIAFERQK